MDLNSLFYLRLVESCFKPEEDGTNFDDFVQSCIFDEEFENNNNITNKDVDVDTSDINVEHEEHNSALIFTLFCCIMSNNSNSFEYLFNKYKYQIINIIPHEQVITKSIPLLQRQNIYADQFKDLLDPKLMAKFNNSCVKLLSHCIIDLILFDCSYIVSTLQTTDEMGNINPLKQYPVLSYYTGNKVAGIGLETIQIVEKWIGLYKQVIIANPSVQFCTTFCRELPHLYAESLLKQTIISPLVEKIDNDNENDHDNGSDSDDDEAEEKEFFGGLSFHSYRLSKEAKELFGNLYDIYAKTSWDQVLKDFNDTEVRMIGGMETRKFLEKLNPEKKPFVMSIEDFRDYILSCGAGYVNLFIFMCAYIYIVCEYIKQ